jgi:hypothetical protein
MVSQAPPVVVVAAAENGKLMPVLATVNLWLSGSSPPNVLLNPSAGREANFCAESSAGDITAKHKMKSNKVHCGAVFRAMLASRE